jgi:hypothetical protein
MHYQVERAAIAEVNGCKPSHREKGGHYVEMESCLAELKLGTT